MNVLFKRFLTLARDNKAVYLVLPLNEVNNGKKALCIYVGLLSKENIVHEFHSAYPSPSMCKNRKAGIVAGSLY
jgi:hypothetical protein